MKQIVFQPKEEIDLNDRLVNLYGSKLVGLYSDFEPLFDKEGIKPALPLLLWLHDCEAYEKADIKVMIFGRETNNWNDGNRKHLPNGTYNFDIQTNDDIIAEIMGNDGICDTYDNYCRQDSEEPKTPFTKKMLALVERLRQAMPGKSIECIWNNIHKVGNGTSSRGGCCGQPTAEIQEIVKRRFDVVPQEINILKPDIMIFLTGKDADNAIMNTFGITKEAFVPVNNASELFLDRVNIPDVKYAARTIHPSRKSNVELNSHFEALINNIIATFS
ncbi:MAG: hypothetical protein K2F88_07040 [Duncaniella sp.]|nr:hypothetical protein [Duncaniella sp.]